jgi:hypothetical protein
MLCPAEGRAPIGQGTPRPYLSCPRHIARARRLPPPLTAQGREGATSAPPHPCARQPALPQVLHSLAASSSRPLPFSQPAAAAGGDGKAGLQLQGPAARHPTALSRAFPRAPSASARAHCARARTHAAPAPRLAHGARVESREVRRCADGRVAAGRAALTSHDERRSDLLRLLHWPGCEACARAHAGGAGKGEGEGRRASSKPPPQARAHPTQPGRPHTLTCCPTPRLHVQKSSTRALPSSPEATRWRPAVPMQRMAAVPAPRPHRGRPADKSCAMRVPSPPPEKEREPAVARL